MKKYDDILKNWRLKFKEMSGRKPNEKEDVSFRVGFNEGHDFAMEKMQPKNGHN